MYIPIMRHKLNHSSPKPGLCVTSCDHFKFVLLLEELT